jgi:O-antigen ligase
MQPLPHNEALPPGVEVPFAQWGPWRMFMIYASVWLTSCTLWIALTRRRSVQILLLATAANGLALAALGAAQRLLPNGRMFWLWKPPPGADAFFSSFVYKNHAGAFLFLAIVVSCGMAGWYYLRGLRRLEKSNPSGVFAFFATIIAVAVLISYARGATITMLLFLVICVAGFVVHQLFLPSENRKPVVAVAMIFVFGYFLKSGLEALDSHIAWDRLAAGIMEKDTSLESRRLATRAALDMLDDHWLKGIGAGSFKFLFPAYQQRYPEIFAAGGRRMFWEHAHNDIVEIPVELGITGMLLLAAAVGYFALSLIRAYFWENPLSAALVLGLALLVGYSWWDFPFQNPAILLTWWVLLTVVVMWTQFEELNVKG